MVVDPIALIPLLFVAGSFGGLTSGMPLSLPPLPEDRALVSAAPEECLFYVSWYGTAEADPESENATERLLAEEEVRRFVEVVYAQVIGALREEGDQAAMAAELLPLVETALTRPAAISVARVGPIDDGGVHVEASLVVNTGPRRAEVGRRLALLERLVTQALGEPEEVAIGEVKFKKLPAPAPVPPIQWGFEGDYFILAVGEETAQKVVERLRNPRGPPEWLKQVHARLPVERPSMVEYIDIERIVGAAAPFLGVDGQRILGALGVDNLQSLSTVTGLDGEAALTRTLLAIDGQPKGLFALADVEPLTAGDLKRIPRDSTWAFACRLDLAEIVRRLYEKIGEVNPEAEVLRAGQRELEDELGVELQADLLEPLGDVWSVYNSPGEGGLLLTGLTAVVEVDNPVRLGQTMGTLLPNLRAEFDEGLRRFEFRGHDVHYIDFGSEDLPLAPAWTVTQDSLVFALYPQSIKAFLSREEGAETLANIPQVAEALNLRPTTLSYQDSAELFRLLYPIAQAFAPAISEGLAEAGLELPPDALPSAAAIAPHLRPAVGVIAMHESGILCQRRETLPVNVGPTAVALLLPAVQAARQAAGRTQAMNGLRQLALAMHNYHDTYNALPPPAIYDDEGKPLLSWRVRVLPFLDQQALYQRFKLDEPWDSPHNKKLIAEMPQVFQSPRGRPLPEGHTCLVVPTGKDTLFPPGEKQGARGVTFAQVTDGLSNTLMLLEAGPESAVPWTKPDDWEFDPKNPRRGLLGHRSEGFLAAFADGSVRFISESATDEALRRAFLRNDGQVFELP